MENVINSKMIPAQYLQLFFDRDLLNFIVKQSVIYHTQKKLRCQQLTIELLARFLGFLLYAGCVPLPGKEYYWQSSTRQEQVTEHLSRNEMHAVKAQIHFANNAEQPRDEQGKPLGRFFKVQRLVELVNNVKYQPTMSSTHHVTTTTLTATTMHMLLLMMLRMTLVVNC